MVIARSLIDEKNQYREPGTSNQFYNITPVSSAHYLLLVETLVVTDVVTLELNEVDVETLVLALEYVE